MKIQLVYLAAPRFGGWVAYTSHLARSFASRGHEVYLFKLGTKFESKLRPFADGLHYQNVGLDGLCELSRAAPTLLTAVGPKFVESASKLLACGAGACIHDPTELSKEMLSVLKVARRSIVTIRQCNLERLQREGVGACYIPHPYVRIYADVGTRERRWHAVSISRLDWDKHTEIIAEANLLLLEDRAVRIYGSENTMFTHHKVALVDESWKRNYFGRYASERGASAALAREATYVVDMSAIAGDGDGTQYTFLEAWDAGAVLVVNQKWLVTGKGEVNRETALVAKGGADLAALLCERADRSALRLRGEQMLAQHAPEVIVPRYEALFEERAA